MENLPKIYVTFWKLFLRDTRSAGFRNQRMQSNAVRPVRGGEKRRNRVLSITNLRIDLIWQNGHRLEPCVLCSIQVALGGKGIGAWSSTTRVPVSCILAAGDL
jgi:hypothetical protein